MKKDKRISLKLISALLFFIVLWFMKTENSLKLNASLILVISAFSLVFIIENKNTSKNDVYVGLILGIMAMSYNYVTGILTAISYIGGTSVLKKSNYEIKLFKSTNRKDIFKTVLLAITVGLALGVFNFYLGKSSIGINPSLKFKWIFMALYAGVSEEVIFRFFFFAICIWITKEHNISKFQSLLCYLIMVIPHVLNHFNRTNFELSGVIMLSLLFGFPFAIMQRRQDLSSAIGAHAIVDLIRFTMFGL